MSHFSLFLHLHRNPLELIGLRKSWFHNQLSKWYVQGLEAIGDSFLLLAYDKNDFKLNY